MYGADRRYLSEGNGRKHAYFQFWRLRIKAII